MASMSGNGGGRMRQERGGLDITDNQGATLAELPCIRTEREVINEIEDAGKEAGVDVATSG